MGGSQERQIQIAERRHSSVYDHIWKAHQSGFALTQAASLQSVEYKKFFFNNFRKLKSHFSRMHSWPCSIMTPRALNFFEIESLCLKNDKLQNIFRPRTENLLHKKTFCLHKEGERQSN